MKQALIAMLLLVGCLPKTPQLPEQSTCPAKQLQALVGKSASTLQTMRFGSDLRIIRPLTRITQDYRENRLNITVDADELISRVYCG